MILNEKNFSIAKLAKPLHDEKHKDHDFNTLQIDEFGTIATNGCWAVQVAPLDPSDPPTTAISVSKEDATRAGIDLHGKVKSLQSLGLKPVKSTTLATKKIMPPDKPVVIMRVSLDYLKLVIDQLRELTDEYSDHGPDYAELYFVEPKHPLIIRHKHKITGQMLTGLIMPADPDWKDTREIDGVPVTTLIEMGMMTAEDVEKYFQKGGK